MLTRYLLIILLCTLFSGCDVEMNNETAIINKINTDLGILPKLMSLPKQPLHVKWEVNEEDNKDNGTLVALLHYSADDYRYIMENSRALEANNNDRMPVEFYKKWVPIKLRDSIKVEEKDNTYELMGIKPLDPGLFRSTGPSPYVNGNVTPLGD